MYIYIYIYTGVYIGAKYIYIGDVIIILFFLRVKKKHLSHKKKTNIIIYTYFFNIMVGAREDLFPCVFNIVVLTYVYSLLVIII